MARLASRPALTGLRSVAVALVVLHHLDVYFMPDGRARQGVIFPGGFVGVDVFFVLSGFLITTLLLEQRERHGRISYAAFWRDRLYRLLPPLIPLLAAVTVVWVALGKASPVKVLYSDVVVLLYATNWAAVAHHDVVNALGHCWSLAVEGQFYLLWPLVVIIALRRRLSNHAAAGLLVAGIVAATLWRAYLWHRTGVYFEVFPRTEVRADSLLLGALVSVSWRAGWIRPATFRPWAPLALAALLVVTFSVRLDESTMYFGGYTLVAAASAVLVVACLEDDWWLGQTLAGRIPVYVGTISYGIYLWHLPAIIAISSLNRFPAAGAAIAVVGAVLAAALSWRFVEKPALALRRRRGGAPHPTGGIAQTGARGRRTHWYGGA